MFSVDELTGMWSVSHTLQLTRRQFPGLMFTCVHVYVHNYSNKIFILNMHADIRTCVGMETGQKQDRE